MKDKKSAGLIIYAICLMIFPITVVYSNKLIDIFIFSHGVDMLSLAGWLLFPLLGVGILKQSNFIRILTVCINSILAFWTPIMYFYLKDVTREHASSPFLFNKNEFVDLFLTIFGIFTIFFLVQPKIKEQFVEGASKGSTQILSMPSIEIKDNEDAW